MGLWSMVKDTVSYSSDHITQLPQAIKQMRDDPVSYRIIKRLGYIFQSDKLPVMLVSGTFYLLHQQITAWQKEQQQTADDSSWNTHALLHWGLISLQIGVHIYQKRQALKFRTHVIFFNADIGKVLAQANPNFQFHTDICKSKACSFLRVSQGLVRDVVSYILTDIAITGLQSIGSPAELSFMLRAMNEGRFVLSMVVAGCNREQSAYAAQNPGLVLAIGLGYTVPLQAAICAAQYVGLPQDVVDTLFAEIFLVLELLIVSTFKLPKPREEMDPVLQWGDPIGFFQWGVGYLFDIFALGLKQKIDRTCQQPHHQGLRILKTDPCVLYATSMAKYLCQLAYWIYSPSILRDKKALMSDPIVGVYLDEVLQECIPIITKIEQLAANQKIQMILQILIISPKQTSLCIRTFYNLPAPLIIGLLHVVKQGHVHERLVALRTFLESFLVFHPIQIPFDARYVHAIPSSKTSEDITKIQEKLDDISHAGLGIYGEAQQNSRLSAAAFFEAKQGDARSRSASPLSQDGMLPTKQRKLAEAFFKPMGHSFTEESGAAGARQRALASQYFGGVNKM